MARNLLIAAEEDEVPNLLTVDGPTATADAARYDDVVAQACHELRTPLTAASGNAQLLRRQLGRMPITPDDRARLDHWLDGLTAALARIGEAADRLDPSRQDGGPLNAD